jgi:hypothetical protein
MKDFRIIVLLVLVLSLSSFLFAQRVAPDIVEEIAEIEEGDSIEIESVEGETEKDEVVRIGKDLTVSSEDTIPGDAVVISSNLTIHGVVEGDAVCISGNLLITGTVHGDAVCVGGHVAIESTAVINGDIVCIGGKLSRDEGSTVGGEVVNISLPFIRPILHHALKYIRPGDETTFKPRFSPIGRRIMGFFLYVVKIIALLVFIFLILLFFRGGVEKVSDAIENHFWKAALAGFVGVILILPLTILLIVLIIGIPLIPLLWIAIVAGLMFGFACITYTIGRIAAEKKGWKDKSPYILALIGLVVIEIITFLGNLVILPGGGFAAIGGVIKILGFMISYVAWIIGFGGVILTRFGAKKFGG